MAKSTDVETVTTAGEIAGYDDSQFEWETVHTESPDQIVFENIGDTFIGEYLGQETITFQNKKGVEESFVQLLFKVHDQFFVCNAGYDLLKAYEGIPPHTVTRTQLRTLVDVGQESPMKSYRVDQAKTPVAA